MKDWMAGADFEARVISSTKTGRMMVTVKSRSSPDDSSQVRNNLQRG